jgi:hypothetical protein
MGRQLGFSMLEEDAPGAAAHPGGLSASGTSPTEGGALAHSMVERIVRSGPTSHAEALKTLRMAFPDSPLTVRVAALAILMRRSASDQAPR